MDLEGLRTWLSTNVESFQGPIRCERLKGGQSNPAYRLDTPSRSYILRTKPAPAAKLLPGAHAIEREYRVQRALAGTPIPVPRMRALCEDESVAGVAFYVMEFVQGRVLWDPVLPEVSRDERVAMYEDMNRVVADLHAIDATALGLEDFGRSGNYISRQVARWSRQYREGGGERIAAMDRLMDWLQAHTPPQQDSRIVHGDFRLDNLMWHPTEPRIVAVIDWELSTLGDPLADFAYHCLAWRIAPGQFRGIGSVDHAALGIPDETAYVRRYCDRTGRDMASVREHWNYYTAFNLFRLAAILHGIGRRVADGTATNETAAREAARALGLAELGWQVAIGSTPTMDHHDSEIHPM